MNIMVSIRHISRSPISGYIIRGTLCRECNNNSIHWWRLGGGRRGGGDLVPSWAGGRSSTPPPTLSHGHLQFGEINYKISGWAGVREGGRKRDGEREENPKMCPFHLIAHEASNLELGANTAAELLVWANTCPPRLDSALFFMDQVSEGHMFFG